MNLQFSETFDLLVQEAHLAKNTLLSGFDLLLKANLNSDLDGYFYSAFFHTSIGIERLLKLVVVVDHMLGHELVAPSQGELKAYGHNLLSLYRKCGAIKTAWGKGTLELPLESSMGGRLLIFFDHYATQSRYHNLNSLSSCRPGESPLATWWQIARDLFENDVRPQSRESLSRKIYQYLEQGLHSPYTSELNFSGHVMTTFDVMWRQEVIKRAAPLAVWQTISLLKPIYAMMDEINAQAAFLEHRLGSKLMVIPHLEDFFEFLLSDRVSTIRRKRWLEIFNG